MKRRLTLAALAFLAIGGCDSTPPTAPPPTPELSLSQTAVALSRTSTSQVTATSTVSSVPTDVTAAATWGSDNAQVVTVSAGLILAVGPGTANITAEHAGQSKTVAVTVRRRIYLTGEVRVHNLDGDETIDRVFIAVDGDEIGAGGGSGRHSILTARMSFSPVNAVVEPGNRTLTVRVVGGPPEVRPEYRAVWVVAIRVRDLDTSELLAAIPVAPKTVQSTTNPQHIDWAIVIPAFTS